MYNLEYYDVMMELLADNLPRYLKSPLAKNLVVTGDFPNMILCCKSCPVSLTFIRRVVAMLNGMVGKKDVSNIHKLVTIAEGVSSNAYMFHINISNHTCVDFIINICEQKQIRAGDYKRHVIVLNIVDTLKNGITLSIKSIMNKYVDNAMFIVRNDENFLIDSLIVNSGQRINLTIDNEMFVRDFERATGISVDGRFFEMEPMNVCIAAQIPAGGLHDVLGEFVAHHLSNMVLLYDQDIDVYGKALRDFCIKIGASGVQISTVCMQVLKWTRCIDGIDASSNAIEENAQMMHLIASMDHAAACVKKPLFALEKYVDDIVSRHVYRHIKTRCQERIKDKNL